MGERGKRLRRMRRIRGQGRARAARTLQWFHARGRTMVGVSAAGMARAYLPRLWWREAVRWSHVEAWFTANRIASSVNRVAWGLDGWRELEVHRG